MSQEYVIQAGDTFYHLAKRWGGTCADWLAANPHLNPHALQIGQKVVCPVPVGSARTGRNQYASAGVEQGKDFAGETLDEVEMELAGLQFRIRRIGETRVPHEIHLLLPRAEIRKVEPNSENGPCEIQIMLSNVDLVHSPRLVSGSGDRAETGKAPAGLSSSGEYGRAAGGPDAGGRQSPAPQGASGFGQVAPVPALLTGIRRMGAGLFKRYRHEADGPQVHSLWPWGSTTGSFVSRKNYGTI